MLVEKKKYILISEDEPGYANVLENKLSSKGFKVGVARDGAETMIKLREEQPDLLVLDLMMPKKDGFSVLRDVRSDKDLGKIPVIIVSNLGQEVDKEKVLKMGAVDYFIKTNVSIYEIVEGISKHLK